MAKPAAEVPLAEIQAVIDNFGKAAITWTRKAQREAIIDWRDRRQAPGVHVRFLPAGHDAYQFSARSRRYQRRKGYKKPDYVNTGAFRESLLKRKPKGSRDGAEIVTRFSLMGGAINLLASKYGSRVQTEVLKTESVAVKSHMRTRSTRVSGGGVSLSSSSTHQVRGYSQTRKELRVQRTPSNRSYAQEFQVQFQDQAYLNAETNKRLLAIVRRAAFKKDGTLRESFREEMRLGVLFA